MPKVPEVGRSEILLEFEASMGKQIINALLLVVILVIGIIAKTGWKQFVVICAIFLSQVAVGWGYGIALKEYKFLNYPYTQKLLDRATIALFLGLFVCAVCTFLAIGRWGFVAITTLGSGITTGFQLWSFCSLCTARGMLDTYIEQHKPS